MLRERSILDSRVRLGGSANVSVVRGRCDGEAVFGISVKVLVKDRYFGIPQQRVTHVDAAMASAALPRKLAVV